MNDPNPSLALLDANLGGTELALGVTVALLVAVAVLGLLAQRRLRALEEELQRLGELERLEPIQELLKKADEDRQDLDQRRLEHVLADVRDGIKRLEGSVLGALERQAQQPTQTAAPRSEPSLRERVVNRLLALGYSDIRIVTDAAELEELNAEDADGSVVVEARRESSLYKGRVLLRAGSLTDVELKPFYPIFP